MKQKILYRLTDEHLHPQPAGLLNKAVNNGLGRIRYREHSPVLFRFEFHAPLLKPGYRIPRHKLMERAEKFLSAPRIMLYQLPGIKFSMGNITTTSSGYPHLI